MTRPKRFKSLLFYEVGKAALMEWRASLLGRDAAVRAPEAAERRALARGLATSARTELSYFVSSSATSPQTAAT
jgi:hypothetical protein